MRAIDNTKTRWCFFPWVFLFITVLIQCDNTAPTTNPVQAIDVASFEKVINSKDFNGFVVAMAPWCPPCREELPQLAKLYTKYRNQGIQIVAISIDADGVHTVQPLIDKLKIPFPVYWVGTKAIQKYKLVGIPVIMVVQKGIIVEKLPGQQSNQILENKIKRMLS